MSNAVRYYNLESAMLRAGVKKNDLAELLNVTRPTIWNKFKGFSEFTLNEALKVRDLISERLDEDINLEDLFKSENVTEE